MGTEKGKIADMTGQRFGRLVVLNRTETQSKGHTAYWNCRCDCGKEKLVSSTALKGGYTKSCGCLKRELLSNSRSHDKRLYQVWQDMKQRCSNPNNKYYHRYGARGISVCAEWLESYDDFYTWAVAHDYARGLQIDRINNDGNYTPDNCRWATPKENTGNRSVCLQISYNGETHNAKEWAKITGIPARTIVGRYHTGKPPEEILKTKLQ